MKILKLFLSGKKALQKKFRVVDKEVKKKTFIHPPPSLMIFRTIEWINYMFNCK